jgi:D-alanyl-D-alanine dipeptidase
VDLTIVPLSLPPQEPYAKGMELCECHKPAEKRFKDNSIDMGTGFDCFHPMSWTASNRVGPLQRQNRLMLKAVMDKYGFRNYRKEWWHYTFRNEPFPKTYFNFTIK